MIQMNEIRDMTAWKELRAQHEMELMKKLKM